MNALRIAGALFLATGMAAAPLNLLHAEFFSGGEITRVPLQRQGSATAPQSYAPLIINLTPAQSPVMVFLESAFIYNQGDGAVMNRYTTHLISGASIAAKGDAVLATSGKSSEPRLAKTTLLRARIDTAGVYSVLVSEAVAPGIVLTQATLSVRANTRRADIINVLAGIAFMLIGAVTLFATGKRRQPKRV